jgi:hypothetical protein
MGTKFADFMQEIKEEARSGGPEAEISLLVVWINQLAFRRTK